MVIKKGDRVVIVGLGPIYHSYTEQEAHPGERGIVTNCLPAEEDDGYYAYKVNNKWFFKEELELDKEYYRGIKLKEILDGL